MKIHRNRRLKNGGSISRQELDYLLPLEVKTGKMFSKNGKILPLVSRLKCMDIFVDRMLSVYGKERGPFHGRIEAYYFVINILL